MSYHIFDETSLGKFIELIQNKVKSIIPTKTSELTNDSGFTKLWEGTKVEYDALTSHDANTIYKVIVSPPTVTVGTYNYNGKAQGPTIRDYDSDDIIVTGVTGVNAGSYTLTLALKNTNKCEWPDFTDAPKTYAYTIKKAPQTMTLSATSVTLNASNPTATITVTGNSGELSASSNNDSIEVSVSGSTITVSSPSQQDGKATITVTAEETENYEAVSKTITVTAGFLKIVTWASGSDEEIAAMIEAADAGKIKLSDYWKIGDSRDVSLSAMGATNVSETHAAQTVQMVLMNAGGVTLTTGKTCHYVVGLKDCLKENGYMNSSDTNSGSWNSSARRKWCNNEFYNAVPSGIRSLFKKFKCVTATSYNGGSNTTSEDYFALPAAKEVFGGTATSAGGSTGYSNLTEFNVLTQFEYYKTSANRIKKVNGSDAAWWGRSPYYYGSSDFCYVSSDGTANSYRASYSYGLAPFGCI